MSLLEDDTMHTHTHTTTTTTPATSKNLAVLLHLGTLVAAVFTAGLLNVIVPAIAFFLFRNGEPFLREHVRHQLNFQLTRLLVTAVCAVLTWATGGLAAIVTVPVVAFFFLVDIIASIRAALAASRSEHYEFPFAPSWLT